MATHLRKSAWIIASCHKNAWFKKTVRILKIQNKFELKLSETSCNATNAIVVKSVETANFYFVLKELLLVHVSLNKNMKKLKKVQFSSHFTCLTLQVPGKWLVLELCYLRLPSYTMVYGSWRSLGSRTVKTKNFYERYIAHLALKGLTWSHPLKVFFITFNGCSKNSVAVSTKHVYKSNWP